MAKKSKLKTPDWVLEGYDSKADYEKAMQKNKSSTSSDKKQILTSSSENVERKQSKDSSTKGKSKTFKIRVCPKCESDDVGLVLSNSDSEKGGGKEWKCNKCKWTGTDIQEKELTENELMKYMDKQGEEVA